jgi:hypothetical protein
MSSEVMEIDPRGDIKLCVGETDPVTFTVCSRALARTSPVFERMLYGNFMEAKKPDHGEWTVSLPADNATAMSLFLRISHGQFDHIPRTISIDDLYDLTVLSNYYDATRMLEPWVGRWMSSMEDNEKRTKESMAKCLGIAWEFGFHDFFVGTTRRMLMESDGSDDPDLQMVPDIVGMYLYSALIDTFLTRTCRTNIRNPHQYHPGSPRHHQQTCTGLVCC